MSINEWNQFCSDFELADNKSKYMKKADLDRLLIAVDATSVGKDAKDKALSRVEFLTCLVRLAVMKYILPGKMADVSESVDELLRNDLGPYLDPTIFSTPDDFRREHLYSPEVAAVLLQHEPSLRHLFGAVAKVSMIPGTKKLGILMGMVEWKTCVHAHVPALIDAHILPLEAWGWSNGSRACIGRAARYAAHTTYARTMQAYKKRGLRPTFPACTLVKVFIHPGLARVAWRNTCMHMCAAGL